MYLRIFTANIFSREHMTWKVVGNVLSRKHNDTIRKKNVIALTL